jgi:hypothetical protein
MDPRRIFTDPFGNFFDDLFSVPRPRAGDGRVPLSPWGAEPEVIPIPATRRDRNPTRSTRTRVDGPDAKPKRKAAEARIPIRVDGPDAKLKRKVEAQQQRAEPVAASRAPPTVAGRRAPSVEAAAVRVQAAARGFLARRAVRAVRRVEKEAEAAGYIVCHRGEDLRGNQRARVAAGEALMRMLLRLDAVRGARDYRRKITRRVLALQDAVDALEPNPPAVEAAVAGDEIAEESAVDPVLEPQGAVDGIENEAAQEMATEPEVVAGETDYAETEATIVDIAEEAEHDGEIEMKSAADTEVDGGSADGGAAAAEETQLASNGANPGDDKPDGSDADWEIVTEEAATAPCQEDPAGLEVTREADAGAGIVDTGKMMEMLTALCKRNAQQCALIGALVERVDALERTVRRMEDAERGRP